MRRQRNTTSAGVKPLIFSLYAAILWDENNNSEVLLISLVSVPVALFCGVLLIDDSNRHQFACGERRGLHITFRQERKNKEDEETIAGEIIGSAGDESPLGGVKEGVGIGYSVVAQTASGFGFICWLQQKTGHQCQRGYFSVTKADKQDMANRF